MKMPGRALAMLIAGLMLTTTLPLVGRHLKLPDFVNGFAIGVGIVLELAAVVQLVRLKKAGPKNDAV